MRTLPTRLLIPIAAVAALALLGAGCGSSKKTSSNATSAPRTTASTPATGGASAGGRTLAETATDFKFSQPKPTVKSGAVTIKEVNRGQTPHSIELEGNGIG